MASFTSQLTSCLLLVHMVLGCCACHVPLSNVPCATLTSPTHAACHDQGQHQDEHRSTPPSNGDEHRHDCQGEHCIFVLSKPVQDSQRDSLEVGTFVNLQDAVHCPLSPHPSSLSPAWHPPIPIAATPLRRHLLLRVLLI